MRLITKKSQSVIDYKKKVLPDEKPLKNKSPQYIEKVFWKNITKNTPLYGSDVPGSLFEKQGSYPWSLNNLDSSLRYFKK